jgi:hypothetical protein
MPPPPPPMVAPAPAPAQPVGPSPLESGPQPVMGKWGTTFYGFAEFDAINDSTQSFNDSAGNAPVLKATGNNWYTGSHHRTIFGMRNSRFGFKLNAPEVDHIKASAVLEMDFLGNQPPNPPTNEQAFWTNPTVRVRHFALKVETPVVDMMFGQYWQLFGWQTYFHPNTVEIQGVPGQVFGRAPQARLSKTIKSGDTGLELAIAASRPPQRDSAVPDGQAGIKFTFGGIKAVHTMGSVTTAADGLGIGVSGVMRRFILPGINPGQERQGKTGSGISIDGLIPIIPGSLDKKGNSLTLTGSFVTGSGINDLYTGLTGGLTMPAMTNADGSAGTFAIDNGLVTWTKQGALKTINWQSYILGLQYYLPISNGNVWVAGNYSSMYSSNALRYNNHAAGVFNRSTWYDVNLFYDMTKAVRFGGEYAQFKQRYGDGHEPRNKRLQFSAFYIF